jgi:predicted kinase
MHGLSGSGKTVASEQLVEALGAVRLRSDVERKRIHGIASHLHAAAPPGQGLYDEAANRATREWLLALARKVMLAGYPVVVDATFLDAADRARFATLASELRAPFRIVSCIAPAAILRERVSRRERAGADASDAGLAVLEAQLAAAQPLDAFERAHEFTLDTSLADAAGVLDDFAARLRREVG